MAKQSLSQQVTGILIIAIGLGFLLQTFNVISFGHYLADWWPLALIAVGLVGLTNNNRGNSLVLVVLGSLLLLSTLGYVTVSVWALFWPLMLVFVGVSMFMRWPAPTTTSEKAANAFALFGGVERWIDTKGFEGGTITAIFGGAKLDLRKATIAKGAVIDVLTAFGGADIIVPEDCRVVLSGLPIFGAWEEKTVRAQEPTQTLIIRGTSLFGGVTIKN